MKAIEMAVTGFVKNGRMIIRHPNGVIEIKAPAIHIVPVCDPVTDCEFDGGAA
jgi:hypothetical protein